LTKISVAGKTLADFPDLVKLFDKEKHPDLEVDKITAGSQKKLNWICPDKHFYKTSPYQIIMAWLKRKKFSCPECEIERLANINEIRIQKRLANDSLQVKMPEVAKLWHPTKNLELTPDKVLLGSNQKVWWKCPKGSDHEWEASTYRIVRSHTKFKTNGCPCCNNTKLSVTNRLDLNYPEITKLWHPTNNGNLKPEDVIAGGKEKRWWKCPEGSDHEWPASIQQMVRNREDRSSNGCPFCRGLKVSITNSLEDNYPHIAEYWHPSKNGNLSPANITTHSNKKRWWKCPVADDHIWEAPPDRLVRNYKKYGSSGCPACSSIQLSITNSLILNYPEIATEWDVEKNKGLNIEEAVYGSGKNVWWKCTANHSWKARIVERTVYGKGCSKCSGIFRSMRSTSKIELYLAFELSNFFSINPDDRKLRILSETKEADIKIPELNLIIEFDGSYWHKGKEQKDLEKTKWFNDKGWKVIRIREMPLGPINDEDIVVPQLGLLVKPIADMLLQQIEKVCKITIPDLDSYLKKKKPVKRRKAEEYIAKILKDEEQTTLM